MKGDKWWETRHRQDRRGGHHHSGRQMKGDKAQTRPECGHHHSGRHMKGDKWRETRHRQDRRGGHHHSGRHMKGDKTQTRPERRTPPLRETHEGRQMKGDKAQTRAARRTPPLSLSTHPKLVLFLSARWSPGLRNHQSRSCSYRWKTRKCGLRMLRHVSYCEIMMNTAQ